MDPQEPTPLVPVRRFGAFEVDLRAGELRKHGLKIFVQDQPFRILETLLKHPGELVTREELCQRLWPDGTFVDFDRGLNSAVNRLREALGDSVKSPRFIETVPRKGYRFIAPIEGAAVLTGTSPNSERTHQPRPFVTLGLMLLISAGALIYFAFPIRFRAGHYRAVPLTSLQGIEQEPSFSPDGNQVVFSWDGGGKGGWSIYIQQIGSENRLRLTPEGVDDRSPAWSPDGRTIAFVRKSKSGRLEIQLIPAIGGPERKLAEVWGHNDSARAARRLLGLLAWSADSRWLVIPDRQSPESPSGLSLLSVDTGTKRALTVPSAQWMGDFSPSFSPDGRKLAFRRLASSNAGEAFVLSLSDDLQPAGEPVRITFANTWLSNPLWTKDGRHILFSSGEAEEGRCLYRLMPSGKARPEVIATLGEDGVFLAISHATRRLAYSHAPFDTNIWRADTRTPSGRISPGNALRPAMAPFIVSTRGEANAQYSPDGRKIAIQSQRSGSDEIWICNMDGSHCIQLTSMHAGVCGSPHWSPDGSQIVFHSRPKVQANIFVIPSSGGSPRQLTDDAAENITPSWSHDGKWIYFASRRSGEFQVWKMPSEGGRPHQITRRGGSRPEESPDGRFLYYTKFRPDQNSAISLWRLPLDSGEETLMAMSVANLSTFAPGKTGIYFLGEDLGSPGYLLRYLEYDKPALKTIGRLGGAVGLGFALSPDERWVLFTSLDQVEGDLMLLENFP